MIEGVKPEIDAGRFPIKRVVGDTVIVEADVFADGHDSVAARLLYKREGASSWDWAYMTALGNDHWRGEFSVGGIGRYIYTIAGAIDRFGTWRGDLTKRIAANQDVRVDLLNGGLILEHIAALANGEDAAQLAAWAKLLKDEPGEDSTQTLVLSPKVLEVVRRYPDEALESIYERELRRRRGPRKGALRVMV